MENFAISRRFNRASISDLLAFATAVKTALLASTRITLIPTLSDTLAQVCDALRDANARAVSGTKIDRLLRDNQKVELVSVLDKIALQVQYQATDQLDNSLVYEAVFSLRNSRGPRSTAPLGAAEIVAVARGKDSGTIFGRCRRIDGAVKFALEWSDDNGSSWHNGQYSLGSTFALQGLTPEKRYWIRARPLGTNNRVGNWSEPATLFVL